ncbi:MAG TPA: preprotein translocase subunit SecE [Candidatus Paceibacterota bacterium]|jgi:preprotein translocase SecE subunit|nr:preprotein translocase subunit SecE [Candidatus Paceibacterota bacterium]
MNLFTYLRNVRAELAHVVWPDYRTAFAHTLIIIAIAAFVGVFIGVLDYAFTHLVNVVVTR